MTGARPSMARLEELRRLYESQGMSKAEAKRLALADAQYEADERESIQEESVCFGHGDESLINNGG